MKAAASAIAREWRGSVLGLLSVIAVTTVIAALGPSWHVANVSMLYLIGVLATATLATSRRSSRRAPSGPRPRPSSARG